MKTINTKLVLFAAAFLFLLYSPQVFSADNNTSKEEAVPSAQPSTDMDGFKTSPPVIPAPEEYGGTAENTEKLLAELACGNQVLDKGEECDDGNKESGDGCSSTCKTEKAICGNSKVEAGEECGEAGLPPCVPPKECSACACVTPKPVCGNGKAEEGEVCGEEGLAPCAVGYECRACACVSLGVSICGNGVAEPGEECNEAGLTCTSGLECNKATCKCLAPGCGNGIKEEGETCGEPGLAECSSGLTCSRCHCVESGCNYLSCSSDSRCQVQYCAKESGGCTWGTMEAVNASATERKMYDSGTVSVPECSAQISYQAFVNFNPCTGEIDPDSYDLQAGNPSITGGSSSTCPQVEPGVQTGQVTGCEDAIDPRSAPTATVNVSSGSISIQIECRDCCGTTKTARVSIRNASNGTPVSCNHPSDCPTT